MAVCAVSRIASRYTKVEADAVVKASPATDMLPTII